MQKQDMDLVLSTDVKPRLKWTPVLHQRFVEAVAQLGGADKATPKNLMRVMGIPGLTLYHLKSHLQKYRLGKSQQSEICSDNDHEGYTEADYIESEIESDHINAKITGRNQLQIDESLQIAQALHMQMEVQEKLHKQIEVQRHLQLRIEAQGKYLQSILSKAQETLAGCNTSSLGLDYAKTEVSELVSMVDASHFSSLTKAIDFPLTTIGKGSTRNTDCSLDSSLTSSESSLMKHEDLQKLQTGDTTSVVLQLMDTNPIGSNRSNSSLSYQVIGRKRSGSIISDDSSVEQPLTMRSPYHQEKPLNKLRKLGLSEEFDMNCTYQNGASSGRRQELDLNSAVDESFKQFNA